MKLEASYFSLNRRNIPLGYSNSILGWPGCVQSVLAEKATVNEALSLPDEVNFIPTQ
ncbi:hypothetical protein J7E81_26110 [Bacillus sp. ISL-18]|uniref:hypothetical protein n=1 Tax=Bacillus sp. ISL-18 TaxID=2819118 RepID=UPI001BEB2366|nr:hypothetical protein [Bacillus sp. ISL-18]MBT2658652.1 hypothetical protein [Bacillus sp. ISL-18]